MQASDIYRCIWWRDILITKKQQLGFQIVPLPLSFLECEPLCYQQREARGGWSTAGGGSRRTCEAAHTKLQSAARLVWSSR